MLVRCQECGGEVSSEADRCPHCGCRYPHFLSGSDLADLVHGTTEERREEAAKEAAKEAAEKARRLDAIKAMEGRVVRGISCDCQGPLLSLLSRVFGGGLRHQIVSVVDQGVLLEVVVRCCRCRRKQKVSWTNVDEHLA